MFRDKHEVPNISIIKKLDVNEHFWLNEAFLVSVENGKGALIKAITSQANASNDYMYSSQLLLNNKPLVQCRLPGCSTCAGLLATGYGIENADCGELKEIRNTINSEYKDLKTAVEIIEPLLLLLESGLYIIADTKQYPTDGNGNFFWAVNNSFTLNPATASAHTNEFNYVGSVPVFLYPSQSTNYFDEERVSYYIEMLSRTINFPRTISYHLNEFISVLLDGHHKAAAAALLGKEINSIIIIPAAGYSYKSSNFNKANKKIDKIYFNDIQIDAKEIPSDLLNESYKYYLTEKPVINTKPVESKLVSKEWNNKYIISARKYPTIDELADILALKNKAISDELINDYFKNLTKENTVKLRYIVSYFSMINDIRTKYVALKCAKNMLDYSLTEASFKALSRIKNDPDIEQFFIEHLIDDLDKHSMLNKIAESYWD